MELDLVIEVAAGVIIPILGYVIHTLQNQIRDIKEAHDHLSNNLPKEYIRRDSIMQALERLQTTQDKMVEKVDNFGNTVEAAIDRHEARFHRGNT